MQMTKIISAYTLSFGKKLISKVFFGKRNIYKSDNDLILVYEGIMIAGRDTAGTKYGYNKDIIGFGSINPDIFRLGRYIMQTTSQFIISTNYGNITKIEVNGIKYNNEQQLPKIIFKVGYSYNIKLYERRGYINIEEIGENAELNSKK